MKNTSVNVRVEAEVKDALERIAHNEQRTLSNLVAKILNDYIQKVYGHSKPAQKERAS